MPIKNTKEMMKFIKMFKQQDPKAFVTNMVNEAAKQGNPVMQNLAELIKNGETDKIEPIVRNIAKEQGMTDFDDEFKAFKQMFKL